MIKKLLWLNIISCFFSIEFFIHIIVYLHSNFGIIGLKDKYFINNNIIFNYTNHNIKDKHSNILKEELLDNFLHKNDLYKTKIKKWWYNLHKKPLNLDNPLTFNEKIQWLKLYDSTPIKTLLADKYEVRNYIKKVIGEEYLIPIYGVYDNSEDINFDKLPNKFVIKCNHGSGFNIIVKNKTELNLENIKKRLNIWMKQKYGLNLVELHYRDMIPKIIIEKYMDDGTGDLRDYKITCFNGKPEFIWIDSERHTNHKRNLYDLNWNQLPYKINSHYATFQSPEKPKHLKKLLNLASILSKGFASVRVDFYIIQQKIYFGEMTFATSSGMEDVVPESFDKRLCSLIRLPKLAYSIDIGEYYILENPLKTKLYLLYPCYMIIFLLIIKLYYYILKLKGIFHHMLKIILIFYFIRILIKVE